MIDDILFKLGRKLLPAGLYTGISRSVLGRDKGWKRIETYAAAFAFYKEKMGPVAGKRIIEVGSGFQYYTAFFFLHSGARDVSLADPKMEWNAAKAESELGEFNRVNGSGLSFEDVKGRIFCYRDLSGVPASNDGSIDIMCSFLVLEHVSDLPGFFRETRRLLKPGGISCNLVDLSDHTYHVFAKFGATRKLLTRRILHHLRYSDRMFALLNDPKCYMNRRLLPEYSSLIAENGFGVRELRKEIHPGAVVHPDLRARHPEADGQDLKTVNFYLELLKPG